MREKQQVKQESGGPGSLQDRLLNDSSFLINCKVIILGIIQSCFYTLVQVLQGDEVL